MYQTFEQFCCPLYIVLFTVLHRCSNCVVKNGSHVSTLCGCHRSDTCVTHSSHMEASPLYRINHSENINFFMKFETLIPFIYPFKNVYPWPGVMVFKGFQYSYPYPYLSILLTKTLRVFETPALHYFWFSPVIFGSERKTNQLWSWLHLWKPNNWT